MSATRSRRMTARRVLAAALTVAAASAGPLAGISSAHQSDARTDAPRTNAARAYADEAVTATNKARTAHHLAALRASSCLHDLAVAQARRMAAASTIYHQDLGQVIRDCHLESAGENVAYGFTSGTSVVTQGWMRSSGHRANILNPDYSLIGIGARKDAHGVWFVSQVFGGT